jgi:ssDNA thymidine ADP-ribosyltransferase, DarT
VRARGIRWLPHFTNIGNLAGIVEHGLLPRAELEKMPDLQVFYTDPWRLDGNLEASSLSVSGINHDMLDSKRKKYPQVVWAVIFFQPCVLWTHDCRFCFCNAAHKDLTKTNNFRGGPWGFDTMFEDEAPTAAGGSSYREEAGIPPCFPTREDAEVQIRGRIAPELIVGVVVQGADPDLAVRVQALMDRLNTEDSGDRNVLVEEF